MTTSAAIEEKLKEIKPVLQEKLLVAGLSQKAVIGVLVQAW